MSDPHSDAALLIGPFDATVLRLLAPTPLTAASLLALMHLTDSIELRLRLVELKRRGYLQSAPIAAGIGKRHVWQLTAQARAWLAENAPLQFAGVEP